MKNVEIFLEKNKRKVQSVFSCRIAVVLIFHTSAMCFLHILAGAATPLSLSQEAEWLKATGSGVLKLFLCRVNDWGWFTYSASCSFKLVQHVLFFLSNCQKSATDMHPANKMICLFNTAQHSTHTRAHTAHAHTHTHVHIHMLLML